MKKNTIANNKELNCSTFNSGKRKGLEAITSPVSTELKNGKQFYTYTKEDVEIIEKELKALEEIVTLHDKWLGNEMSDFEFFTLLSEIKDKYGLQ